MNTAERNRAIKKALSREFGAKNVRVRGGRGTAYGWVDVTVTIPVDFQVSDGMYYTEKAKVVMDQTRSRVIQILKREGLWDQLGIWYDDDPNATERKEIIIDVNLKEAA